MKLLVVIILFLCSLNIAGQNKTICLLYAPADNGIGFRYDKQIDEIGVYGSANWGSYWLIDGERIRCWIDYMQGIYRKTQWKALGRK